MPDPIGRTMCGILNADGSDCLQRIPADAPINACMYHMLEAYQYARDRIADAEGRPAVYADIAPPLVSFVYYVRNDGQIKIGTTRNLWTRMQKIPGTLLAAEPGDEETERQRHKQFAAIRIARNAEWFYATLDLEKHVIAIRERYGDPIARRYENGRLRPLWRLLLDNAEAK